MRRKATLAVAIATIIAVSAATANEVSTQDITIPTGVAQVLKDGQVVQTFHTYKLGEIPSPLVANAITLTSKPLH